MSTQETIDQAARVIREREQRKYDEGSSPVFIGGAACRDIAQALAGAGLLADPDAAAEMRRRTIEIDDVRKTNARLNRRAQLAEAALHKQLKHPNGAQDPTVNAIGERVRELEAERNALWERVRELEVERNMALGKVDEYRQLLAQVRDHLRELRRGVEAEHAEEAALADALATIQRVRDLHQPHPTNCSCHARRWDGSCSYAGTCNSCHCGMPCPTIRALDQEAQS